MLLFLAGAGFGAFAGSLGLTLRILALTALALLGFLLWQAVDGGPQAVDSALRTLLALLTHYRQLFAGTALGLLMGGSVGRLLTPTTPRG